MANGEMKTQAMLLEMAIKQGTATVLAGLLLWAFWAVVIKPGAAERERYSKSITTTSAAVAESTSAIKDSVVIQQKTLHEIKEEIAGQTELRSQAMETMGAFAKEMRDVNPANAKKLDVIVEKITTDDWSKKLDILLEMAKEAQEADDEKPE